MTTINIKDNIKLSKNNFDSFTSFIEDFSKNNFPNSNIDNEYEIASDMKKNWLPDTFIKNFVKSYE